MPSDVITQTNQKIFGSFSNVNILNAIGWIVLVIIVAGAGVWFYFYWRDKKTFNKKITAFEIVGINFVPSYRDTAKSVKIGKGGFEILYLKKLKTWKIAYGGRVGKNDYYFFIMPDGYWYNGMLSSNIYKIDEQKGLVPIVTTNPTMRSQYTALEKQIDTLHQNKSQFWEKYGSWILAVGFVLVSGVLLWLMFKEFRTAMNSFDSIIDKLGVLIDRVNVMTSNQAGTNSNLVPVK